MEGEVIRVENTKGYAFVRSHEDGFTYFLHVKDVDPPLDFDRLVAKTEVAPGTRVDFEPKTMPPPTKGNGLRAFNARVVRPQSAV